jgi:hypothetical protein
VVTPLFVKLMSFAKARNSMVKFSAGIHHLNLTTELSGIPALFPIAGVTLSLSFPINT